MYLKKLHYGTGSKYDFMNCCTFPRVLAKALGHWGQRPERGLNALGLGLATAPEQAPLAAERPVQALRRAPARGVPLRDLEKHGERGSVTRNHDVQ